jgi:hypothetical protein
MAYVSAVIVNGDDDDDEVTEHWVATHVVGDVYDHDADSFDVDVLAPGYPPPPPAPRPRDTNHYAAGTAAVAAVKRPSGLTLARGRRCIRRGCSSTPRRLTHRRRQPSAPTRRRSSFQRTPPRPPHMMGSTAALPLPCSTRVSSTRCPSSVAPTLYHTGTAAAPARPGLRITALSFCIATTCITPLERRWAVVTSFGTRRRSYLRCPS